jgi:uncharacterized phage-associated protein
MSTDSQSAAVRSAFDVAMWFSDRARVTGRRLQPMTLQQLLFLAQAWFGALHDGRPLMPAVFVADELGPVEPNVHAAFSRGHPALDLELPLPVAAEVVLERVWKTYGQLPGERLLRLTMGLPAVQAAGSRGRRSPIPLAEIAACLAEHVAGTEDRQAEPPRVVRTHNGRTVRVAAWRPAAAKPQPPA